jgi:hypothetical protein
MKQSLKRPGEREGDGGKEEHTYTYIHYTQRGRRKRKGDQGGHTYIDFR